MGGFIFSKNQVPLQVKLDIDQAKISQTGFNHQFNHENFNSLYLCFADRQNYYTAQYLQNLKGESSATNSRKKDMVRLISKYIFGV